jgi:hypothetical protein
MKSKERIEKGGDQLEELVNLLQTFIAKRGWKLKIAKKDPIEQSLFIHAINELGTIKNYLQSGSHPFNEQEIVKLYIASITHDCEKETEEWQEKVHFREKPPHHTNPEYAKKFLEELLDFLKENKIGVDFDEEDINDIISPQSLHMKASAESPSAVFMEMSRKHKSERWSEITHIVDLFDDIVSIESVESAIGLLNKDEYRMLNERLEFTYHKIGNVRGILTSLLHKACEKAYEQHNFMPFLYYVDGTLYFQVRRNEQHARITMEEIKKSFKRVIDDFIHNIEIDNKVVIKNPQTKLFRGREFFDKELIDKYFRTLRRKYRAKIDKAELKLVIEYYFGLSTSEKETLSFEDFLQKKNKFDHKSLWATATKALTVGDEEDTEVINNVLARIKEFEKSNPNFVRDFEKVYNIGVSKPQQYMFQLFKEIVYDDECFSNEKNFQSGVRKDYDSYFGEDAYNTLKSKSTSNPQIDFERYIKPYWEKEIQINAKTEKVRNLEYKKQEEILSQKLSEFLRNNIDRCSKLPKGDFSENIANLLIYDLVYPLTINASDIEINARDQLSKVGESKEKLFNKTEGARLCPICYKLMPEVNLITAAFLSDKKGVAKVFSNQAVGGSSFGSSVNICKLCYAELLLRRVILGRTPSDLVILFPSLNFAKLQASKVMELVRYIQNNLGQFYSYHNPNLNVRVQLNNLRNVTTQILEKSAEEISAELNPEKFVETFTIKISDKTRKDDLKKLEDKINEFWGTVEGFNKEFRTTYKSFQKIAEDIFENKVKMPMTDRNQIIEEAGVNPIRYSFIYETPNFIVISLPMTFIYKEDEAEVNILLKRLLFASYLYVLTDCAVMVIPGKEVIHMPPTRKIVYVQPNATLKQVIKEDWISLFDLRKWMVAISAAVNLAREGDYSSRSGIFEILTQPTVGHVLSRISTKKQVYSTHINMLDKLQNTGVLRNETIVDTKV